MLLDVKRNETVMNQIDYGIEALLANIERAIIVDFVVLGLVIES